MRANHVTRQYHTGLLFEFCRASISDNGTSFLAFTSQQSWISGPQISGCGQNHGPVGVVRTKLVGVARTTNWWVWPESWTSGCDQKHKLMGVVRARPVGVTRSINWWVWSEAQLKYSRHEHMNHISLKKAWMLCKVTHCAGQISPNTRSHQLHALGWPRAGNCYLMHRIQPDGWLYPEGR